MMYHVLFGVVDSPNLLEGVGSEVEVVDSAIRDSDS